jgi:hypothetical protein
MYASPALLYSAKLVLTETHVADTAPMTMPPSVVTASRIASPMSPIRNSTAFVPSSYPDDETERRINRTRKKGHSSENVSESVLFH